MREIKFRGKRINNGEWAYGCLEKYSEDESIIVVDLLEHEVYWVGTATVGQYTGLKDKNGKEIYEGDVVLTDMAGWVGHVIYGCDCFMVFDDLGGFSSYCNWEVFEVIGSIHDKAGDE